MPSVVATWPADHFPIAAIEREGDADFFAIVTADFEAIGTLDADPAVVFASLLTASMAFEQEAVDLHHPVNPLVIGPGTVFCLCIAAQDRLNLPIAVGMSPISLWFKCSPFSPTR